jgi:hypothetical protein
MTMLMQECERPSAAGPRLPRAETERTHVAEIKRACVVALGLLLGGGGIAAIIALKSAIYLSRLPL